MSHATGQPSNLTYAQYAARLCGDRDAHVANGESTVAAVERRAQRDTQIAFDTLRRLGLFPRGVRQREHAASRLPLIMLAVVAGRLRAMTCADNYQRLRNIDQLEHVIQDNWNHVDPGTDASAICLALDAFAGWLRHTALHDLEGADIRLNVDSTASDTFLDELAAFLFDMAGSKNEGRHE